MKSKVGCQKQLCCAQYLIRGSLSTARAVGQIRPAEVFCKPITCNDCGKLTPTKQHQYQQQQKQQQQMQHEKKETNNNKKKFKTAKNLSPGLFRLSKRGKSY